MDELAAALANADGKTFIDEDDEWATDFDDDDDYLESFEPEQ